MQKIPKYQKMNEFMDFLTGNKLVEEVNSPINGKITVVKSLSYGTHIQVGGLTQSGGIVNSVWKSTLKKTKGTKLSAGDAEFKVRRCLILGLGAGTAAKLVKNCWPDAKITGVEIDPVMVELGKKYFGLDESEVNVVMVDAYEFLINREINRKKVPNIQRFGTLSFDLILVDIYIGDKVPEKFETEDYIHLVKGLLSKGGVAVFNRLYYGEKRTQAKRFGLVLEKNFAQVIYHYPQANIMFICLNY